MKTATIPSAGKVEDGKGEGVVSAVRNAPLISLFARPYLAWAAKGERAVSFEGTMPQLTNPILPGFNPDPSIVRVGDDYYIATSTFEWYPGVQIHHRKDLANWDAA